MQKFKTAYEDFRTKNLQQFLPSFNDLVEVMKNRD